MYVKAKNAVYGVVITTVTYGSGKLPLNECERRKLDVFEKSEV